MEKEFAETHPSKYDISDIALSLKSRGYVIKNAKRDGEWLFMRRGKLTPTSRLPRAKVIPNRREGEKLVRKNNMGDDWTLEQLKDAAILELQRIIILANKYNDAPTTIEHVIKLASLLTSKKAIILYNGRGEYYIDAEINSFGHIKYINTTPDFLDTWFFPSVRAAEKRVDELQPLAGYDNFSVDSVADIARLALENIGESADSQTELELRIVANNEN